MIMLDRALVTLEGRRGLVTGIANDQSIAWGCAKAFRGLGAELAVTYLNEKAKPHVEPLARQLEAGLKAQAKAPARSLVSIDDVGLATAYLATDAARLITGQTIYVDGGYHIID